MKEKIEEKIGKKKRKKRKGERIRGKGLGGK